MGQLELVHVAASTSSCREPRYQDSGTRSSLNGVALGPGSLRSGVFTSIGDSFANFYHLIVELRSELILSDFVVGLFGGCECVLCVAFTEVNNREQRIAL